jgi:hypothetical protein
VRLAKVSQIRSNLEVRLCKFKTFQFSSRLGLNRYYSFNFSQPFTDCTNVHQIKPCETSIAVVLISEDPNISQVSSLLLLTQYRIWFDQCLVISSTDLNVQLKRWKYFWRKVWKWFVYIVQYYMCSRFKL